MKKILTGKIKLIAQEGGHAAPIIQIGEKYDLEDVLLLFPYKESDHYDKVLIGEYKITIERLEIK